MNQLTKEMWPGWETVRVIGKGGFGTVYEIEKDGEKAALKKISIPQSDSEIQVMYSDGMTTETVTELFSQQRDRFMAEYSLMKKLGECPQVVRCEDARFEPHEDGIGWDIYMKMELLTPLTRVEQLPEEQVLKLGAALCKALALCQDSGIIHRDIKPQNIFVSDQGDYKLGDFGIAKVAEGTMGGTRIGTYKYMAPEVYNNQPYGAGADIYSLGLVLYWLLNERRLPFLPEMSTHSDEERAKERRFSGEPLPEPVQGSEDLKKIVLKACAFDPKDRYESAAQMGKDLEAVINGEPVHLTVTAVGEEVKSVPNDRKFCKNCGNPIAPGVRFCKNCGAVMEQAEPVKKKKNKLVIGLVAGIVAAVLVVAILLVGVPMYRYSQAKNLMESGNYWAAMEAFENMDGYRDSESRATECYYLYGKSLLDSGACQEAKEVFQNLDSYQDSVTMITECDYCQANIWLQEGKYEEAKTAFTLIATYKDSADKIKECRYYQAVALLDEKKYDDAIAEFTDLDTFMDSQDMVKECHYRRACEWMEADNLVAAYETLVELGDYKDSAQKAATLAPSYNERMIKPKIVRDGFWYSQGEKGLNVEVVRIDSNTVKMTLGHMTTYGNNELEFAYWWHLTAKWDPDTGRLYYSDGRKVRHDYRGNSMESTDEYYNGSGYFYYENDYLYWVDHKENMGEGCYCIYSEWDMSI